ncbi:MAG: ABC transporter permease [Luteimonas sp.]
MIGSLFLVELLKIRRSMVVAMTALCPLAIVLLAFVITLRAWDPPEMSGREMLQFWFTVMDMWTMLVLPLFLAVTTGLINGNEHRNQTWRVMLSLPIDADALYTAKLLVSLVLMLCAHAILLIATVVALFGLGLLGYDLDGAFALRSTRVLWAAPVAALAMLVIQHGLSWHVRSIVVPFTVAVIGAFLGLYTHDSKQWWLFPWAYPDVATTAQTVEAQVLAIVLGPVLGVALYLVGLKRVRAQEVA